MKTRIDEQSQRILVLLKLDAKRIYERIRDRKPEYLYVFSVKRTREHFKEVFKNRYKDVPISDLKHCSQEVIVGLDSFYTMVDEMHWYLNHTENMPGTVEHQVETFIKKLDYLYETLNLYINAELDIGEPPEEVDTERLLESIDLEDHFPSEEDQGKIVDEEV